MKYDIFYVSKTEVRQDLWQEFKGRFANAQLINNLESLDQLKKKSFTKFFWVVWDDLEVLPTFNFDYRIPVWDEQWTHVFKNGEHFDGVCIFSKDADISQREFNNRFFVNKKEIDIVASRPLPYECYSLNSYEEYMSVLASCKTEMFWAVWKDITVKDNFNFDYQVISHNQNIVHIFKNGEHFDGICLFPKHHPVTQREFENRFFIDKKEINIPASVPIPYERHKLNSYEEYMSVMENCKTDMFWATWDDQLINDDFNFDYQVIKHNQNIVHVFKNGEFYDGICLFPKKHTISKKEFDFRFFTNKKEIGISATIPKPFDIIFLSYNEPKANENYAKMVSGLDTKIHTVLRVNGVKGIHNAHIEAAKLATTDMFWVVDADAIIAEEFNFTFEQIPFYDKKSKDVRNKTVHVWHSRNPINDLIYGYGGVKLLPREMTINMDTSKPDMTTSISDYFKVMPDVSNVTAFNVDEFSTWRSAFRECVKLSSKVIDRTYDQETEERLEIWCTTGADRPYGDYAIAGATAGRDYGSANIGNIEALEKINDFNWLEQKFKEQNV